MIFVMIDEDAPLPSSTQSVFSTRLVVAGYAGACMRVRRSNDNAEADIGFSGGWLDTTALLAHCGANSGFVVSWYDQGLGNTATTAVTARQPRIVNAGVVETMNSQPAIYWNRVAAGVPEKALVTATSADFGFGTGAWTQEFIGRRDVASTPDMALVDYRTSGGAGVTIQVQSNLASQYLYISSSSTGTLLAVPPALGTGTVYNLTVASSGGTPAVYEKFTNGISSGTASSSADLGSSRPLTIGANFAFGAAWEGHIGELIITKGTRLYSGNHTARTWP